MYIVNTGMMFNLAWRAISVLLGEKTKKKINILSSKFIHELEEEVSFLYSLLANLFIISLDS